MYQSKNILCLLALIISASSLAGIKELTWHSRANCINNESITWHLGHSYILATFSGHFPNDGIAHLVDNTGASDPSDYKYEKTWRSAAVHWGEGANNTWTVIGEHFMIDDNGNERYLGETNVTDCSIYDGWWD